MSLKCSEGMILLTRPARGKPAGLLSRSRYSPASAGWCVPDFPLMFCVQLEVAGQAVEQAVSGGYLKDLGNFHGEAPCLAIHHDETDQPYLMKIGRYFAGISGHRRGIPPRRARKAA